MVGLNVIVLLEILSEIHHFSFITLSEHHRSSVAAVCVKAAGFTEPTLVYETDLDKTKEAFRKTKGDIYILAASAFGNEGKILEVLKCEDR